MNASAMAPVRSRARSYRATITAIAALALALVGCSSDDTKKAADASDTSAAGSSESSAKTTDSAAATNTKTVDYGVKPWTVISAPANCMCSDGSPYEFYVREANPKKVLFFLQGGGACFDAVSCAPGSTRFTTSIGAPAKALASTGKGEGIFDLANDENPFKDYSIVYAPYCTGDVHLGTKTNDYGNGVAVQHKGNINATTAMEQVKKSFPDATEVVVAGESAGSIPSPLFAGLLSDKYPDAKFTVFADGSGGYPNDPAAVGLIGGFWGTGGTIPDWPETAGIEQKDWNFARLYIAAQKHNPNIVMTRHDFAFDATQVSFAALAGFDASELDKAIDQNEATIEAGEVNLLSFIEPGKTHTTLSKNRFYTQEVNGIRYRDWLDAVLNRKKLNGKAPADVHCVDCSIAAGEAAAAAAGASSSSVASGTSAG